jgi:prevent-host-death family protein
MRMDDIWQASAARHRFSEVVEAAVEGRPQIIRRRDGREVVVVSKEYYEETRPSLKSILLSHRFGERGDVFDAALEEGRAILGVAMVPEDFGPEAKHGDGSRHRRSE